MLYHGSKTPHIKTLKPFPHKLVDNEQVVFATNDIRFALSMIHGTSNDIDIGHNVNQDTNEDKMYVKEMIHNAFNIMSKPGTLYTLEDSGFVSDSRLSRSEMISKNETKVINEEYFESISDELRKYDIDFIHKTIV